MVSAAGFRYGYFWSTQQFPWGLDSRRIAPQIEDRRLTEVQISYDIEIDEADIISSESFKASLVTEE